jgi:hypothetical protein
MPLLILSSKKKAAQPLDESVVLFLRGAGENGSTNIVDSSLYNHSVVTNGNIEISTDQSAVPGGSSIYFDGSSGYIDVALHPSLYFGNQAFTI